MKRILLISILLLSKVSFAGVTVDDSAAGLADVSIGNSSVVFDPHDATVVDVAAHLLADDVKRVTGKAISVNGQSPSQTEIIIGTIGQSNVIDALVESTKLDVSGIKGQWESYVWQIVNDPAPNVKRALVIAGSDRRGTAYGVVDLSRQIGVSPWIYWADVPATRHAQLRASGDRQVSTTPKVKYRGIFLNDEDWALRPWSTKTLDPQAGAMGPKTYEKIFELMLRLKLNFIWPAMHPGGTEFSMYPGNAQCADRWAIVMGASHCEPMMRNNVFWPKSNGDWRYDTNRDAIYNYWQEGAQKLGNFETVWTEGIRGIHDSPMKGPKDLNARVKMVEQIITDQRKLIDEFVTKKYGPPAQCFIPYKEVLPIYNAGMKVPDDVTLVWPDDNFGYIRRIGTPEERARSGGSGVYYHFSYLGGPKPYLWVESTSPGLTWEEMRKAYDNDSKTLWIVNVGDIKPAEVCIDFWSRLAWDPAAWDVNAQDKFLASFDTETFGSAAADVQALQNRYYQLASIRKPEHIDYKWVDSLPAGRVSELLKDYRDLMEQEAKVAAEIPADRVDSYFETVGYAARMLAATGQLYMTDDAKKWMLYIHNQSGHYNHDIAGGKWDLMMNSSPNGVNWPATVGGKAKEEPRSNTHPADDAAQVIDVASSSKIEAGKTSAWKPVAGLGWSGHAMAVLPATTDNIFELAQIQSAPSMEFNFTTKQAGDIKIHALPTMRLTPTGHLRIAVSVDNAAPQAVDIPGGEAIDESKIRANGVMTNRTTITIPESKLAEGAHTLKIYAMDPGVVLDQIEFPN